MKILMKTLLATSVLAFSNAAPVAAQQATPRKTVEAYEKLDNDLMAKQLAAFLKKRQKITIEPLPDVPGGAVQPLLINGKIVDPEQFPAVFRMTTGGTCTASLVGPSTIYFAAHCLGYNFQSIEFKTKSQTAQGICEQSPHYSYKGDQDDWALCLLNQKINVPLYESVDIRNTVRGGKDVLLTGYGCTKEGGKIDGRLRAGKAQSTDTPPGFVPEASTIFTDAKPYGDDGAILCPGDSGGPAFRLRAPRLNGPRSIVGVNSRTTYARGISLIAASASPNGKRFITDWAKRYNQKICGVNTGSNCR